MSFFDSEKEEEPPMFSVYADDTEINNATISFHHKLFETIHPEKPVKEMYLYDIDIPEVDKTEIVVPKTYYEDQPLTTIPKWLRKEVKKDKRAWRQIHQTLRRNPKYDPPHFEPLPKVEPAERKYTQKDDDF